jgi:predicted DNA binding CopG/RHH family protein
MKNEDKDWRDYKLEPDEIELLESVERGEWKSVGNIEERRQELRRFFTKDFENYDRLFVELPKEDFELLRQKSQTYGISYQELVQKLIHGFANGKIML